MNVNLRGGLLKGAVVVAVVALLAVAVSSAGEDNQGQAAQDLAALRSAHRIEITEWTQQRTNRMLIVLDDVPRVLRTIHLEPKGPCWCAHSLRATFKSTTHEVNASFCDHCFDILGSAGEDHRYKMPKEFYAELLNEVKRQGRHEFQQLKP